MYSPKWPGRMALPGWSSQLVNIGPACGVLASTLTTVVPADLTRPNAHCQPSFLGKTELAGGYSLPCMSLP